MSDQPIDRRKLPYDAFTECWYVPGETSIVDLIHPDDGMTLHFKESAAEIEARYPGAQRLAFDEAWKLADAAGSERYKQDTGPDVFIATSSEGSDEITVRARTIKDAKEKIAAELARAPTAKPVTDDPIGGNPSRKTRYVIQWLNPLTSETITIRITHSRDYLSSGTDHIEVESIAPSRAPLPITETGYRSHFMPPLELINAGGPVTFVTAWIEQEARGKAWTKAATAKAQGDLFSWAEARGEVGKRKRVPKSKRPAAGASKKRMRDRAPE